MYCWSTDGKETLSMTEAGIANEAIKSSYSFRDICEMFLIYHLQIAGPGIDVEVNESKFIRPSITLPPEDCEGNRVFEIVKRYSNNDDTKDVVKILKFEYVPECSLFWSFSCGCFIVNSFPWSNCAKNTTES